MISARFGGLYNLSNFNLMRLTEKKSGLSSIKYFMLIRKQKFFFLDPGQMTWQKAEILIDSLFLIKSALMIN